MPAHAAGATVAATPVHHEYVRSAGLQLLPFRPHLASRGYVCAQVSHGVPCSADVLGGRARMWADTRAPDFSSMMPSNYSAFKIPVSHGFWRKRSSSLGTSPHSLRTACEDGHVRVWCIPGEGLTDTLEAPQTTLSGV